VAAEESEEKDTVAYRSEPAGTGAGGTISATRPYGWWVNEQQYASRVWGLTYSEQCVEHFLRDVWSVEFCAEFVGRKAVHVLVVSACVVPECNVATTSEVGNTQLKQRPDQPLTSVHCLPFTSQTLPAPTPA
jgi:hypothetical protein